MGVIGGELGVQILTWLSPTGENQNLDGRAYRDRSKLEVLFDADFFDVIRGKTVIDFGCGVGDEAFEMLHRGAARVIAIDVRQKFLDEGRARAGRRGAVRSDRVHDHGRRARRRGGLARRLRTL